MEAVDNFKASIKPAKSSANISMLYGPPGASVLPMSLVSKIITRNSAGNDAILYCKMCGRPLSR